MSYVISKNLEIFGQISLWDFKASKLLSFWSMVPIISSILDQNLNQIKAPIPSYYQALSEFKKYWNRSFKLHFRSYIVLTYIAMYVHLFSEEPLTWIIIPSIDNFSHGDRCENVSRLICLCLPQRSCWNTWKATTRKSSFVPFATVTSCPNLTIRLTNSM